MTQQPARLNDWMLRLQDLVESRQHQRFAFGVHDCCMWACDAVLAVTGKDPAAPHRGQYSSEEQAASIIANYGDMRGLAAALFGAEIAPAMANVGDIGLIETEGGLALSVCVGGHWLNAGAFGLVLGDVSQVLAAWRCEVD